MDVAIPSATSRRIVRMEVAIPLSFFFLLKLIAFFLFSKEGGGHLPHPLKKDEQNRGGIAISILTLLPYGDGEVVALLPRQARKKQRH